MNYFLWVMRKRKLQLRVSLGLPWAVKLDEEGENKEGEQGLPQ